MRPFDYRIADTAAGAASDRRDGDRYLAGGTDQLPLMKLDVEHPDRLVDLKRSDLSHEIVDHEGRLEIGALCTLDQIARDPRIGRRFALLAQAAQSAATPQIRNRATVGGNLLQRPRCWYFRSRQTVCWLRGGDSCPAKDGENQQHAIFQQSPCVAVHPSDLAPALWALDAEVDVRGIDGRRTLPIAELYSPPSDERRRETVLEPEELITTVRLPALPEESASVYLKAMDRKVWAFALVSVAAVRRGSAAPAAGAPARWSLVLGGVANQPVALAEEEVESLVESPSSVEALLGRAEPLAKNRYKVQLLGSLIRRALERLR